MTKQQEMHKQEVTERVIGKLLDVLEHEDLLKDIEPTDYEEIVAGPVQNIIDAVYKEPVKRPFTPADCPIQAGMIIYSPETNADYVVTGRYLSGESPDNPILLTSVGTYTGNDLMDHNIEYYPKADDTSVSYPAWHDVSEEESHD